MSKYLFYNLLFFFCFLILLEIFLSLLPVNQGFNFKEVNSKNEILRAEENQVLIKSKFWNFYNSQNIKINNFGFRNDNQYNINDENVVSIIGDSYVEAIQVPFNETFFNVFDEQIDSKFNVYSFGFSGAPLSQYLKWAEYATEQFRVSHVIFNIVANDFDESLLKYKQGEGFFYFKECSPAHLCSIMIPYEKKSYNWILGSSLIRYLIYNLEITELPEKLNSFINNPISEESRFFANTEINVSKEKLYDSKLAIDFFFKELERLDIKKENVIFIVDGRFYNKNLDNYFNQMRDYFLYTCNNLGYNSIDMKKHFNLHYSQNNMRFELERDGHWNKVAHLLVGETIADYFNKN